MVYREESFKNESNLKVTLAVHLLHHNVLGPSAPPSVVRRQNLYTSFYRADNFHVQFKWVYINHDFYNSQLDIRTSPFGGFLAQT